MSVVVATAGCEKKRPVATTAPAPADGGAAAQVVAAVTDATPGPDAEPVDLAPGRWKKGYRDFCVEVFADHTIEIALQEQFDRNPIRIGGHYHAVLGKAGTYVVTVENPELRQKRLTNCKKSWADMTVPERTLLGVRVQRHQAFQLTLRLADGGAQLEVCGAGSSCVLLDRAEPSGRTSGIDGKAGPR